MTNLMNLDDYEQGKLIKQDIEDEVLNQLRDNKKPHNLIISKGPYLQLATYLKRLCINEVGQTLPEVINYIIAGNRKLSIFVVDTESIFFYVTAANYQEIGLKE